MWLPDEDTIGFFIVIALVVWILIMSRVIGCARRGSHPPPSGGGPVPPPPPPPSGGGAVPPTDISALSSLEVSPDAAGNSIPLYVVYNGVGAITASGVGQPLLLGSTSTGTAVNVEVSINTTNAATPIYNMSLNGATQYTPVVWSPSGDLVLAASGSLLSFQVVPSPGGYWFALYDVNQDGYVTTYGTPGSTLMLTDTPDYSWEVFTVPANLPQSVQVQFTTGFSS